jgi:hypothetical protein
MIQFICVLFLPKTSFSYVVTIPYDVTEIRLKYLSDRSYDPSLDLDDTSTFTCNKPFARPRLVLTLTSASLLSTAPRIRLLTASQGLSSSVLGLFCRGPLILPLVVYAFGSLLQLIRF